VRTQATEEALASEVEIDAGQQGDLRFTVQVPETATVGARHVITAMVTLGERRFDPAAEGIIRVVHRST
jgi:serine acetyltransferase